MYKFNKSAGFSLLEVIITVTIVAFLAAIAIPNFKAWTQNTKIRTAAESLQAGIQKARAEALTRNAQVQFVLGANSAWTVGCPTVTATCPAVIEQRAATEGSTDTVIVTPTPAGTTTVAFGNLGTRATNAADFTRLDLDISTSILSAAESRELRVTVGTSGNARMCDPEFTYPANPRGC